MEIWEADAVEAGGGGGGRNGNGRWRRRVWMLGEEMEEEVEVEEQRNGELVSPGQPTPGVPTPPRKGGKDARRQGWW